MKSRPANQEELVDTACIMPTPVAKGDKQLIIYLELHQDQNKKFLPVSWVGCWR
jgi:hypothetical protein